MNKEKWDQLSPSARKQALIVAFAFVVDDLAILEWDEGLGNPFSPIELLTHHSPTQDVG